MLQISKQRNLQLLSTYPTANRYLSQCGFRFIGSQAQFAAPFPEQNIIRLKKFVGKPITIEEELVQWVEHSVIGFLPKMDRQLHKNIVENLWEIVHNGLVHGEGEHGVSSCGQAYPAKGYFELAFYDVGNGIPKLVREFNPFSPAMKDAECIDWAVQKGNSTRPRGEPSGLGLHLLRQFLSVNQGVFQIVSGNGYYGQHANNQPTICTLKSSIKGTLVNIRIVFDNYLYQLKGDGS
jgi:hypothetical protein